MGRFTPPEAQLVVHGKSLSFVIDKLTPTSARLLGKERHSDVELTKSCPVQLILPIPSQAASDTISGTISAVSVWKAVDGERDLVDVIFAEQTEQNRSTIERYLPLYQSLVSLNPEALEIRRSKAPEMVFLPFDAFFDWRNASAMAPRHREALAKLVSERDEEILQSRQSRGVLADLVAMKLKLQYEEFVMQEGYTSGETYLQRIVAVSKANDELIGQWLSPIAKPVIPQGGEEGFQRLKEEVTALYGAQREHIDACKKILKDEGKIRKRDDRAAAKLSAKPPDPAQKDQPVELVGLKDSIGTRHVKRIAGISFTVLCVIIILLILFGADIRAFMLPLEDTLSSMNAYLPIERGVRHGEEIHLYLQPGTDDVDKQPDFENRLLNALQLAKTNGFTCLRVFSSTQKPLYYTLSHKEDVKLYRVPDR